jgi:hypothetical protein
MSRLLDAIKPTTLRTIRDIYKSLGIDVSDWQSASDPRYVFEYSYQAPGFSVVNMNWSAFKQEGDDIVWRFNQKEYLDKFKSKVEKRRATNLVRAIERAADEGLPIRLIVFESVNNPQKT